MKECSLGTAQRSEQKLNMVRKSSALGEFSKLHVTVNVMLSNIKFIQ